MAKQVENGKAFEFAIATSYYNFLKNELHLSVELLEDSSYTAAKSYYIKQSEQKQFGYDQAALKTIETMLVLEPGLFAEKDKDDILRIRIAADREGQIGDVRDVIFERYRSEPNWEVGISAKNNHEAVKHSRMSMTINFGKDWLTTDHNDSSFNCSITYFEEIGFVFEKIRILKAKNPEMKWSDMGDEKEMLIYQPLLNAFKKEMLRLNSTCTGVPERLLSYLIGRKPFYKIIKDDKNNLVIIKAFNLNKGLNKTVNKIKPKAKTELIKFPKRIIEFEYKENSNNTLMMVLDEGWQISFRIHSASNFLENSLKFDIQLIGNPPVLFSQHLFNTEEG